jgi:hypothetical protein
MTPNVVSVVAVLALVCVCILPQGTTANSNFSDMLVVDCKQNIHILPSHAFFGMDIGVGALLGPSFSLARQAVLNRVACHCPRLADLPDTMSSFFSLDFLSVLFAVSQQTSPAQLAAVCGSGTTDFEVSFATIEQYLGITLPGAYFLFAYDIHKYN